MIEVVKFKNGKYGVRRTSNFLFFKKRYHFLSTFGDYWWEKPRNVRAYCSFNKLDEAKEMAEAEDDIGEVV
jgi:hypothetical protein